MEDGSIIKCTEDHKFLTYRRKRITKKKRDISGRNSELIFEYKALKDITDEDEVANEKDFVKCGECGKLISKITPAHLKSCSPLIDMIVYRKKYPDVEITSELNKFRISRYFKKYGSSFKGHKHTPETKRLNSLAHLGKRASKETREKMSKAHRGKKNSMYGRAPSHGKRVEYSGIKMRSSWEQQVAEYLDKVGIKWEYEPGPFELGDMTYTPDFYLPDYVMYIEVKGYFRNARALEKFNRFARGHDIVLIRRNELKDLSCLESMVALKNEAIYED